MAVKGEKGPSRGRGSGRVKPGARRSDRSKAGGARSSGREPASRSAKYAQKSQGMPIALWIAIGLVGASLLVFLVVLGTRGDRVEVVVDDPNKEVTETKELRREGERHMRNWRAARERGDTEEALASGWAIIMGKKRLAFPLSDHADYRSLMSYTRRCKPKRVLTFHGGNMTKDFYKHVKNSLGIPAVPLTSRVETIMGPLMSNESRIKACSRQIVRTIKIPGFFYQPSWLVREMSRQGFTPGETENSIEFLVERGILRGTEDGVCLS